MPSGTVIGLIVTMSVKLPRLTILIVSLADFLIGSFFSAVSDSVFSVGLGLETATVSPSPAAAAGSVSSAAFEKTMLNRNGSIVTIKGASTTVNGIAGDASV